MPGIFDLLFARGLLNQAQRPNVTDTGDETARLLRRAPPPAPGVRNPMNNPVAAAMGQGPSMVGPSTPVPTSPLAQATAGNSYDMPDVALEMEQANQGPMPNMPDPYASSPLAQQAALDTALREKDGKTDWEGILNAVGQGLVIAGSQDPLKALTQISELEKAQKDSKKVKRTPIQGGAFLMLEYPDGRTEFVKNDAVAEFIDQNSQTKLMRDLLRAQVTAQAGVTAAGQKVATAELAKSAGDAATTALNAQELTRIQEALAKTDTASGPIVGNMPKFLRDTFFPEGTSLQDSAERIIQSSLRQTLGAQFTEKEGAAFLARAFNPRVSEAENARRLGVVIEEIKTIQNNKDAALAYLAKNGTLQGFTASTPAPSTSTTKNSPQFPGLSQNASFYFK